MSKIDLKQFTHVDAQKSSKEYLIWNRFHSFKKQKQCSSEIVRRVPIYEFMKDWILA